jgi:predicted PurR-regulated permease PerM
VRSVEEKTFLLLIIAVSLAFAWILWPFFGAILWGTVLAIVFAPLYRWFIGPMRRRPNIAALATILIVVVMVILPLTAIATSLVQEAASLYDRIQTGKLDFGVYFQQVADTLPSWAQELLNWLGLENLGAVQEKLAYGLRQGSQFLATQILSIGQSTVQFIVNFFVMMYLLFFLLRDGDFLIEIIRKAVPLRAEQQRALFNKFTTVIRATVKGDILVSLLQGTLGGLIFWFLGIHAPLLWGVLMAFLSLLPAFGASLVWLPVAIYLLATGAIWQGVVLIAFGALIIGLVDNFLRPALIGKDTKMPDYVVLISTLGGLEIFGLNGFVIGPAIAAMFLAVWAIFSASWERDRNGADKI